LSVSVSLCVCLCRSVCVSISSLVLLFFLLLTKFEDNLMALVVGIAGGSGSGKSTIVNTIVNQLGASQVSCLHHDSYYKDLSHLSFSERATCNFDHPDSLETLLLVKHIEELRDGQSVEVPTYDFTTHTRRKETELIKARKVIIVDGILIFWEPALRNLFDIRIFVDTDPDIRFIRRLKRDIRERGRTPESTITQYETMVRPMHLEFVEPTKRYAHVIIPEGGFNIVALEMVSGSIREKLNEKLTSPVIPRPIKGATHSKVVPPSYLIKSEELS